MKDLGHEVPQESLVTEKMVNLSDKQQDQVWPCPWSCQSHAEAFSYSWCVLEGTQLSPYQQPDGTVEAEDHLLVLLLSLLFLFETATTEDPASQLPDIFSETLLACQTIGPILSLQIPSVRFLFLKEG